MKDKSASKNEKNRTILILGNSNYIFKIYETYSDDCSVFLYRHIVEPGIKIK